MAKNYFNRYIWLIDLIQRSGHISFENIDRAWRRSSLNPDGERLSERTFFNHKDAIFDTFGIEIKCDRSLGYYINNEEDIESDSLKNWMLQSLSLNSIMNEGSDLRDRIICEDIPSSQKWLPDIMAAMRDGKCLMMTYQGFTKDSPNTFEIAPYCLKYFKQRWYILARTEKFPEGIYSLDRIKDLHPTDHTFKLPKGYEPKDTFRKLYGVILDKGPVETVILRVEESQVKYYRTLPLHHSQEELESGDGYTDFSYRLVPTFDFSREILSKGMYAEVISPLWLRREIAEEMRQAARMYNDIPEDEE
ncbi:MAG: WYL domain-containing protein [Bacteroidales bacterium]|nr:WYL domain-containing protein [Bacteroidales bacterium]